MKNFIKRIITVIVATHKDILENACMTMYFEKSQGNTSYYPVALAYLECVYYPIKQYILYSICEHTHHDWEEHGYAGPESGAIDMECKRCGHNIHHQLY